MAGKPVAEQCWRVELDTSLHELVPCIFWDHHPEYYCRITLHTPLFTLFCFSTAAAATTMNCRLYWSLCSSEQDE